MAENDANCTSCTGNPHPTNKPSSGDGNVFVRPYTPPTSEDLALSRHLYAAREARSGERMSPGVHVQAESPFATVPGAVRAVSISAPLNLERRPPVPGGIWSAQYEGWLIPDISGLPLDSRAEGMSLQSAQRPAREAAFVPTAPRSQVDSAVTLVVQHLVSGGDVLMPSQLTAPWFDLLTNSENPKVGEGQENKEEDVRKLQEALKKLGYDPGPIDGKWGDKTRAALKKYQKDRRLNDDGIAGPNTWDAINKALEELKGADEGKDDQPPGETVPPSKRTPANGYPRRSPGKATLVPPCEKKRMKFDDKRDGPFKGHGETGLVDPPLHEPGPNLGHPLNDRRDNTDRTKDGFKPVVDKGATEALIAGWDTYVAEDACNCCCRMPEFDTTQYGGNLTTAGTRQYNKYDKVFIAAVTWWVSSCPALKALNNCKCICKLARFMKVIAWQESQVGYGSGYNPENPPPKFLDTEDVMQVANPREEGGDLPSGKMKELRSVFGECVRALSPPDGMTNYNISGEQSIFYGTGWFFRKMVAKGASCENEDLFDAAEAYNGSPHKAKYRKAVKGVFETGKFHDFGGESGTGEQRKGPNGKDEIFTPPADDC